MPGNEEKNRQPEINCRQVILGADFLISEALAKVSYLVILNAVNDLNLLKIRNSSLRSE